MQNLTLQMAKVPQARQQLAAQDTGINAPTDTTAADMAATDVTVPFAQLLKKQVALKEPSTNANGDVPVTDLNAATLKAGDGLAEDTKKNIGLTLQESELTTSDIDEKSKSEAQNELNPIPIQDLILMQMGLQSAPVNQAKQAVTAEPLAERTLEATEIAIETPKTGFEKNPTLTMGAQPTSEAIANKMTTANASFAEQLSTGVLNQQERGVVDASKSLEDVVDNKELIQSPVLLAEKTGKERDLTLAQTQVNTSAIAQQATTKASEAVLTAMTMASNEIATPFGKPDWSQAVNQKVVWMVGKGEQSATLTLNPPDMGPLKVVIQVDNDQVDTTFISDNPEVRQALQDGMQMLRDKMQDTGMQLGNAQISSQAQSQRHFEQAMQQRAQQRLEQSAKETPDIAPATPVIQRVANGLVDTFA